MRWPAERTASRRANTDPVLLQHLPQPRSPGSAAHRICRPPFPPSRTRPEAPHPSGGRPRTSVDIPVHAKGLPVLRVVSLCTCRRHYPRTAAERVLRSSRPTVSAFPDRVVGSACASSSTWTIAERWYLMPRAIDVPPMPIARPESPGVPPPGLSYLPGPNTCAGVTEIWGRRFTAR
jgi:hypothetical protein